REARYDERGLRRRQRHLMEAQASGNAEFDVQADWVDYAAAGASDPDTLAARAFEVLRVVDMEQDVYRMGLVGTIDPQRQGELAGRILSARAALRDLLARDPDAEMLVEPFEPDRY